MLINIYYTHKTMQYFCCIAKRSAAQENKTGFAKYVRDLTVLDNLIGRKFLFVFIE